MREDIKMKRNQQKEDQFKVELYGFVEVPSTDESTQDTSVQEP